MNSIIENKNISFEDLKKINEHGAEFWSARDLQPHLGYSQWRRFEDAIARAMESCQASGNDKENHFANAGKMVEIGSKATIGGDLPENIPADEHIKQVEKRMKSATPKLGLQQDDAKGLKGNKEKK